MKFTVKLLIALAMLATIFISLALFFEFDVVKRNPNPTFTVLRGQNAFQIANDLKAEGYISSKLVFLAKIIAHGNLHQLKAGEYDFQKNSLEEIIDKLVHAQTATSEITIIPGWNLADIATAIEQKSKITAADFYTAVSANAIINLKSQFPFLATIPPSNDLEGFLAPDTYQISTQSHVDSLVASALQNFEQNLTPQMRQDIAAQNKSIFEIVTMASMLEKEVKSLTDKKLVAGILWKRLETGMPLQVDSTLLYYKIPGANQRQINKNIDSPYNTYRYTGLPAGPICNPGQESLKAAIYPQKSDYWYYLSTPQGDTIFSRSYGEHLINKAKYLDNL